MNAGTPGQKKEDDTTEDRNFELSPDEMEEVSGGSFDWISAQEKEKVRRVIRRAKQDGATLEDFLSTRREAKWGKGHDLYEYYKATWDTVKVDSSDPK